MRATRRTGRVAALAAVLALPIAATACGSNSSGDDHDTLRVLQAVAPTSFNQNIDPTRTFIRVDANVLETATKFVGTGEDLELKPWLTTEWEQTAPDTWRFEVRPGIEFTNGEPLTAAAFKATLDSVLAKTDGKVRVHYSNLSIEVVDEMTFDVKTTESNDAVVPVQMSALFIMPPEYLAEVGPEEFGQKPIGTGPYKVTSFKPGAKVELEANEDYWGDPKPSVPKVTVQGVGDASTRVSQLLAGSADLVEGVPVELTKRVDDSADADIRSTPTTERRFIMFNTNAGVSANPEFRKAVNLAINRQSIVDDIFDGYAAAMSGIYVPLESGYDESYQPYPYDQDEARRVLADAGLTDIETTLYYPVDFPMFAQVAQAIQAQLEDVGIHAELSSGPARPTATDFRESSEGGMLMYNFGPGYIDTSYLYEVYFSSDASYSDVATAKDINDDALAARLTVEDSARDQAYQDVQKSVMEDHVFWAPLYRNVDIWGVASDLNWEPSANVDFQFATASFD